MATQLTDKKRALIMADYHAGASQNALATKYEVSKATINKMCKDIEAKNVDKVNALTRIRLELAAQSEQEVNAVHFQVDMRTKDMEFFRAASLKIANKALEKIDGEDLSMVDIERAQSIIGKGKENIYGRMPDTAIQINNQKSETAAEPIRPVIDKQEWLTLHGIHQ